MTRFTRFLAALLGALLGLAAATPVLAADGSVPAEVRTYVADGSLVARLADVYGPDEAGNGVEFDETTKTGTIVRVHAWTPEQIAGEHPENPIELVNEWIVPISVGEEPVGLATIWINPDTDAPELATFEADPALATALSAVPDDDALIRDDGSSAWLALADDGTLTPLVPGSTGLSTPVPLDEVALVPPGAPGNVVPHEPNTGLGLAIAVVVLLLVVIVVALIVPGRTRRKDEEEEAQEGEEDEEDAKD